MGIRYVVQDGSYVRVHDDEAGGAISPLPLDSHELGAMAAAPTTSPAAQLSDAQWVAANLAKTIGGEFHHDGQNRVAVGEMLAGDSATRWRLSPEELARVLTYIECGYSLRQAAAAIGRSHSTLVKLQQRNRPFDRELRQRREMARDKPLRHLHEASQRSWRAAAWLLNYLDALEREPRRKKGEGRGARTSERQGAAMSASPAERVVSARAESE